MATLSEQSVVIALRDWQWKHRIVDTRKLEVFVPLSGNADQLLGDILIEPNDRLVLLEVKSDAGKIPSEWLKKIVSEKNADGTTSTKERVKNAYLHLRSQLTAHADLKDPISNEALREFCRTSLAAHHFLYWEPINERSKLYGSVPGKLAMEPYLLGVYDRNGFDRQTGDYRKDNPAVVENVAYYVATHFLTAESAHKHPSDPNEKIEFFEVSPFDLSMVYSESARLIEVDDRGNNSENFWFYIGLEPEAFKSYVVSLCNDPELEIRVVIASISGDVFAHADTIGGLLDLIKRIKVKEQPTPQSATSGQARHGKPTQPAVRGRRPP